MWHVYTADRHLVATYSTKEAADSHIASWPASYTLEFISPPSPTSDSSVVTTGTKSHKPSEK